MIVGSEDDSTPPDHQRGFFNIIPSHDKEIHIIEGAPHTMKKPEHLEQVSEIVDALVKNIS